MVCYARPASRLAAIVFIAWLVFAAPVGHFFDHAALAMAVTVGTVGAAVAAALVFAVFMATRRRRAAAGGCVSCQFRCQHAMTEPGRRLSLVTIADRRPSGSVAGRQAAAPGHRGAPGHPGAHGRRGTVPARSVSVLLPMPAVRSAALTPSAPRWPDRPALASRQIPGYVRPRERAGSPALAVADGPAAGHW